MQRVKNVDYDEDDLYSDDGDDYTGEEQGYSAEDKDNFANLTPVVRAELDEAGVPATTSQIEDALWHYYWDVGKSVAYLKNSRTPRQPEQQQAKKEKPKSKFDEAAQKSAEIAGEFESFFAHAVYTLEHVGHATAGVMQGNDRTGGHHILILFPIE